MMCRKTADESWPMCFHVWLQVPAVDAVTDPAHHILANGANYSLNCNIVDCGSGHTCTYCPSIYTLAQEYWVAYGASHQQ